MNLKFKDKKLISFALCTLSFAFLCLALPAFAGSLDPMRLGVGARSLAMGRTNLVAPGDMNALFVNPANAAYLNNWAFTSMSTSLLEGDMNYTLLGGGNKSPWGGLGLAYLSGGTSGINVTTRDADRRVIPAGTSFDYSNSVMALSWGRMIKEELAGGAMLKLFNKGFSGYSSGSGFDLDLGLLYDRKNIRLGLAIQNVLPTGMSWGSTNEDVPMLIKGGLSYIARKDILVNADMDISPFALHTGVEWRFDPTFALRGGFDQVGGALNLCLGMGLNYKGASFDYAYYKDSTLDANSTSFFTIGYKLPVKKKKAIKQPSKAVKKIMPTKKALPKPKALPAPKPGVKSEKAEKIEAYIKLLETKLKNAESPARREKLEAMIEAEKVRLQRELIK